jgi:hypothetical protein
MPERGVAMNGKTLMLVALLVQSACAAEPPNVAEHNGEVDRVVDGDSLYLADLKDQIRLL